MNIKEDQVHKTFYSLTENQADLKAIWKRHLEIESKVLCEYYNPVAEDIKKQIYLSKAKRSFGILGALLE